MTEWDTAYTIMKYYRCFLKKGPNRDNTDTVKVAEIQVGHLAHVDSLAQVGKVHIVGPFGDDGDIRGVVIFDVATKEEVLELESRDPAVMVGVDNRSTSLVGC
ncbi:MAG: hypothetical protein JKY42_08430 [Flavobacteriales bacterium]|nr:hypothetical protein [Flavobacteriales bacterium]